MTSLVWTCWLIASQRLVCGRCDPASACWANARPRQADPLSSDCDRGYDGVCSSPATRYPRRAARGNHPVPRALGVGSIGDEKRGDLMAGFTKAPFYGAAYVKRGLVKGVALMSRASTQPRVEYVCGLLQGVVTSIARSMAHSNQQEIAKLNEKIAVMTDGVELADLSALKERKIDKGHAANRVLLHAGEYFTAYAEQARMFDVRGALVELTGVLPRGAQPGDIINIARSYGREMCVLTVLQRTGDVEPITLNVLSTVWNRLKGAGGSAFERLTAGLWKEAPTIVGYGETSKKKATLYAVKLKGMMAFAPEWEYDGQDGMAPKNNFEGKNKQTTFSGASSHLTQLDRVDMSASEEAADRVALERSDFAVRRVPLIFAWK